MSNSPLVDYTLLSPNRNAPRNNKIRKITIHHMAGNLSIERCGAIFADPDRQGSANYGIGTDGRVGLYVEEKDRAWTSNSAANDQQAITIEVANDEYGGSWHVSDVALSKLIDLCTDICRRNGIDRLNYTGDATGNLTRHNMFAATTCPGPYLESKFPYIAEEVNKRLEEDKPMTKDEKDRFDALVKKVGVLENENKTLKKNISDLQKSVAPCITSADWYAQITDAMGGKEATAMLVDLKKNGDFAGKDSSHFGLSEQMVRIMLIFYRMLKRLGLYK